MADNFIGNRMDDYRAGKLTRPAAPRRLTPSGAKPGHLSIPIDPKLTVWIEQGALLPAGIAMIQTLTAAGIKTLYRAHAGKEGSQPAIKFGARHYPPSAPAPQADITLTITEQTIILPDATEIQYPPTLTQQAAHLAATLLTTLSQNEKLKIKNPAAKTVQRTQ